MLASAQGEVIGKSPHQARGSLSVNGAGGATVRRHPALLLRQPTPGEHQARCGIVSAKAYPGVCAWSVDRFDAQAVSAWWRPGRPLHFLVTAPQWPETTDSGLLEFPSAQISSLANSPAGENFSAWEGPSEPGSRAAFRMTVRPTPTLFPSLHKTPNKSSAIPLQKRQSPNCTRAWDFNARFPEPVRFFVKDRPAQPPRDCCNQPFRRPDQLPGPCAGTRQNRYTQYARKE